MSTARRKWVVTYVDHDGEAHRRTEPARARGQARQVVEERDDCASVLRVERPGELDRNEVGRTLFDWSEEDDVD